MRRIPTDLKILGAIYERYYEVFSNYETDPSSRNTKVFVPIDIAAIAKDLRVDSDIIFGRLYYHFESKYGYEQPNGARVFFFALNMRNEHHCIHFPYVASVLASLHEEDRKLNVSTMIAGAAVIIAFIALGISVNT